MSAGWAGCGTIPPVVIARDSAEDGRQRRELVRAAARVVSREGVADATTRKIATEAGIPLGKIHYWFASKDELLAAVVSEHVEELSSAVDTARAGEAGDLPSSEQLLELFRAAFAVDEADRGAGLVSYELAAWALRSGRHELARQQVAAFRDAARRLGEPWYAENGAALGAGEETLAQFLAALYDGLVLAWLADPEGTRPDEVFDLVSRLLSQQARGSAADA